MQHGLLVNASCSRFTGYNNLRIAGIKRSRQPLLYSLFIQTLIRKLFPKWIMFPLKLLGNSKSTMYPPSSMATSQTHNELVVVPATSWAAAKCFLMQLIQSQLRLLHKKSDGTLSGCPANTQQISVSIPEIRFIWSWQFNSNKSDWWHWDQNLLRVTSGQTSNTTH